MAPESSVLTWHSWVTEPHNDLALANAMQHASRSMLALLPRERGRLGYQRGAEIDHQPNASGVKILVSHV
jgi:hypothetical protein